MSKTIDLHLFADLHEYHAYAYAGGADLGCYHGPNVDAASLIERLMPLELGDVYLHGDVELNYATWNVIRNRQRNPFRGGLYTVAIAVPPPAPMDDLSDEIPF